MELHQTHNWRYSDSSLYDAVCTQCNYTDTSPQAKFPCGEQQMHDRILELAKQAGIKGSSETALSPFELKFAESLIKECSGFTDPNTRKLMLKHFGIDNEF